MADTWHKTCSDRIGFANKKLLCFRHPWKDGFRLAFFFLSFFIYLFVSVLYFQIFTVFVCIEVNPMGSCPTRSVYLKTFLLGRLSPLSGF